jgi:hypothetical protein
LGLAGVSAVGLFGCQCIKGRAVVRPPPSAV